MPKIACVMMQKDEVFLLRPWLAYHGHLFGFENLFVLDNGSTSPNVRDTLMDYAKLGVKVDWGHGSRQDYLAKGDLIGGWMRILDARREYDFLIPLDCDEFVVLRTEQEFSCSREQIHRYLDGLVGEQRILCFPYQLANHPLNPDIYHRYAFFKVFFAAGTASPIDHGHHLAKDRAGMEATDTRLIHLHFHHKVFDLKSTQARQSWVGTIDVDNPVELAAYSGPSAHLNRFFLEEKDQYYRSFLDMVHFYLPQFRALLSDLGAPLNLPTEAVAPGLEMRVTELDAVATSEANGVVVIVPMARAADTAPAEFRATRFHEGHYLGANPDLVAAGVDPTVHFCIHGVKEGRPLRRDANAPPRQPPEQQA